MKRRNIGALITGLLLLIIGVGFIGEATHLWNFNLFFPGWWTLFIIIPAFSATVGQGFHTGNVAWLIFGVLMPVSYTHLTLSDTAAYLLIYG